MEKSPRRRRTRKTGLPPGTLVHIGERRNFATRITVFDYDGENLKEFTTENVDDCLGFKDTPQITWINVDGIHQIELIEKIGRHFNLHPLTLEDIVNNQQRPKFEEYDNYLYFVLKMFHSRDRTEPSLPNQDEVVVEQVSIILAKNYVISFQETISGDVFGGIRERLRSNHGRIRRAGADYLVYSLMDAVVDHYFIILERTGERLELLESELLAEPTQKTLKTLQRFKRDLIELRKSIWPLREVVGAMERNESTLIAETTKKYLRDVYDHTINVIDTIEAYRDVLAGMLEIYMSSVSNHLNGIMKVLTMIATIFIPLTFIVGVYGMNFRYMPELDWQYGYHFCWFIMILITSAMLIYYRRRKWL